MDSLPGLGAYVTFATQVGQYRTFCAQAEQHRTFLSVKHVLFAKVSGFGQKVASVRAGYTSVRNYASKPLVFT